MRATRRHRRSRAESPDESNWLLTYGDIMTLLMSFFVFIFAATQLDQTLFQELLDSLTDSFGTGVHRPTAETPVLPDLRREIELRGLARDVEVLPEKREVRIFGSDSIFFAEGAVELDATALPLLESMATMLLSTRHEIRVEGHATAGESEQGTSDGDRELSFARALAVVRFLEDRGVEPERLSTVGYGSYRPRYPPRPEHLPRNRRVEIVLIPK